jgi:Mg-chelatase subunit ChlI
VSTGTLRRAQVGDRIPSRVLPAARARVLDAAAVLVPGADRPEAFIGTLAAHADDFAAWDGRLVVTEPDGDEAHRLLIVDRYNQVYAVHDATDPSELPDAHAIEEWFRFLATACPECGVIDDPLLAGPTL